MTIDRLIDQIMLKKNPCVVGIDPDEDKIPRCYREAAAAPAEAVLSWAIDVIDAVKDIVPAVKPQMAFFEVYGPAGLRVHQQVVQHAQRHGLMVIDDSKRGDIGSTARAYARAHLSQNGPVNADFLTVSPFLGTDSMQPFVDTASREGKGLFVLVKTSNPSSAEVSEAVTAQGRTVREYLAAWVHEHAQDCMGKHGYSGIGAVVGATFPEEARALRRMMPRSFFLVPGYGTQGGTAQAAAACFNDDGLGAVVSASRSVLYHHLDVPGYDHTRALYREIVRRQARQMQQEVYHALKNSCSHMIY